MEWLKNEKDDLYNPSYTDMLRVTFTSKFSRGRLADLVALLSGRNFEARTFEEAIAEETFNTLKDGTMRYMNETNFKEILHDPAFCGICGLVADQIPKHREFRLYPLFDAACSERVS